MSWHRFCEVTRRNLGPRKAAGLVAESGREQFVMRLGSELISLRIPGKRTVSGIGCREGLGAAGAAALPIPAENLQPSRLQPETISTRKRRSGWQAGCEFDKGYRHATHRRTPIEIVAFDASHRTAGPLNDGLL